MAALNLSTNGQSINRSYQAIIDAPAPTGAAASSGSYGQWAIFSVAAPLTSSFQQDGCGKESVLKVQGSGDGDLSEMIEEFSDGRIQFAFLKIKDPNTSLPKYALIGWCGEGVPERTKGYFTSHLNTVSKVLSGYHVQISARSDRDLTPEGIMQKVSDASGSRYSGGPAVSSGGPPPKPTSKPVFMPTQSGGGGGGFNPLGRSQRAPIARDTNVDADGWGADAPPVTRTQVEKVASAYQPTKVDMRTLGAQNTSTATSRNEAIATGASQDRPDVVRGAYQPVGKVDIEAIRRQAAANSTADNRPTPVKGAYEPVGKVDIAAIKAKARQDPPPAAAATSNAGDSEQTEAPPSVSSRAAAFTSAAPLTELPKPKVANKFGGSSTFAGTKAPLPGGPGITPPQPAAAAGASRTFADKGGKTPAQLWAEKKGMAGGAAAAPAAVGSAAAPIATQDSGGAGWKSGYTGKSWAPVQISKTGGSAASAEHEDQHDQHDQQDDLPSGRVGALREALGQSSDGGLPGQAGMRAPSPPPLEASTKPSAGGAARGVPMPGLPARGGAADAAAAAIPPPAQPRTPTPEPEEEDAGSPIRVAMPVSSTQAPPVEDAHEEQFSPPAALPVRSMAHEAAARHEASSPEPEAEPAGDAARDASAHVAAATFGHEAAAAAPSSAEASAGHRALVLYDYEKAEDNELELAEGEYVTNIEMVDPDWWMGQNRHGAMGLFPSNYVELVEEEAGAGGEGTAAHTAAAAAPAPAAAAAAGPSATALYDYEAAEDNELTFPEGAKITNVEFPDEDWWAGEYGGHSGLFPANYVQLNA